MRSVALVALIAPDRGRASKKITNFMHTGAARFLWKPKWPWVKPKPPKPPQPSTTGRAVCNARFLLREVHVSGALSGACTGKGPQMANPRPTPKPGNLGPPWPPGTSGNPAGYSRGRRISDAIERLIEEMAPDREFGATAIAMALGKKYMLKRKVKDPETGEEIWFEHKPEIAWFNMILERIEPVARDG